MANNCCDLYNPKTLRAAMGSLFRIDVFTGYDFSKVMEMLHRCGIRTYAAVVDRDAELWNALIFPAERLL